MSQSDQYRSLLRTNDTQAFVERLVQLLALSDVLMRVKHIYRYNSFKTPVLTLADQPTKVIIDD